MVVGAFPVAKLGTLLLRQVSKPIANFAKERAKKHPFFRTYICMPPAQFYNWCEVKMKMWVLNLGKPIKVPPLNEAMAIELGANLLGEAIIFIIAAGVLILEYSRQSRKEAAKEEARNAEMNAVTITIQDLYFQAERQDTQIRELLRAVNDLETKLNVRKPRKTPSESDPGPMSDPLSPDMPTNPGIITQSVNYVSSLLTTQVDNLGGDHRTKELQKYSNSNNTEKDLVYLDFQTNPGIVMKSVNYVRTIL